MRNAKGASSQGQHKKCTQEDVQCKTPRVKPETSSARTRRRMGGGQGAGIGTWDEGAQQGQAVLKEHDMHLGLFPSVCCLLVFMFWSSNESRNFSSLLLFPSGDSVFTYFPRPSQEKTSPKNLQPQGEWLSITFNWFQILEDDLWQPHISLTTHFMLNQL